MANTGSWVWDKREMRLVPKAEYYARRPQAARSTAVPLPMITRTALDDVWNPVDGKRYTCSRTYEKAVRAKGCEIIGNDAKAEMQAPKEPPSAKADIARVWDQLS